MFGPRPFARLLKYLVVVIVVSVSTFIWPIFLMDLLFRKIATMQQPLEEEVLSETGSRYPELPLAFEALGAVISIEE